MSNKLVKNTNNSSQTRREREGKVRMNRKMIEDAVVSLIMRNKAIIRFNAKGEDVMITAYMHDNEVNLETFIPQFLDNEEYLKRECDHICKEIIKLLEDKTEVYKLFSETNKKMNEKVIKMEEESERNNGLIKVGKFKYCDITCMTKGNTFGMELVMSWMIKQADYEMSGDTVKADWYYIASKLCGASILTSKNKSSLNDIFGKTTIEKILHNYVNVYFNIETCQFGFKFEDEKTDIHFIKAGIGTMSEDFSDLNIEYYCETGWLQFKLRYMLENCTENFKTYLLTFFIKCYMNGQKLDTEILDILADYNVYLK